MPRIPLKIHSLNPPSARSRVKRGMLAVDYQDTIKDGVRNGNHSRSADRGRTHDKITV